MRRRIPRLRRPQVPSLCACALRYQGYYLHRARCAGNSERMALATIMVGHLFDCFERAPRPGLVGRRDARSPTPCTLGKTDTSRSARDQLTLARSFRVSARLPKAHREVNSTAGKARSPRKSTETSTFLDLSISRSGAGVARPAIGEGQFPGGCRPPSRKRHKSSAE
jgi:hypothetical protein